MVSASLCPPPPPPYLAVWMTAPLPPLSEGLYLYPPLLTNASGVGQIHLYVIHYLHQLTLLSDSVFLIMELCVRFIVRSSKLFKIVTVTKTILPSFWSYLRDLSFQQCANIFFTLYLGECCCPAVYIIPWISHQYPLIDQSQNTDTGLYALYRLRRPLDSLIGVEDHAPTTFLVSVYIVAVTSLIQFLNHSQHNLICIFASSFSFGIQNPGLWNPEYSTGNPESP